MESFRIKSICILLTFGVFLIDCNNDETAFPMKEIISLEVKDSVDVLASGLEQVIVTASLPSNADDAYRTVTFTTGTGKFQASGKETIEKQIDSQGKAQVVLIAGTQSGTFYITASIGSKDPKFSDSNSIVLIPLTTDKIISAIFEDTAEIKADGQSVFTINGDIDNLELDAITVTSTGGLFLGSNEDSETSKVDKEGKATFKLKVGRTPGDYFITVSISNGIKRTYTVNVDTAFAETLLLEPGSLNYNKKSPVPITVYLKRRSGKVSLATPVYFKATQFNNSNVPVEVGRFTGTSQGTDTDGKVQVQFFADSQSIIEGKPITIHIWTPSDDGTAIDPVEADIELQFVAG